MFDLVFELFPKWNYILFCDLFLKKMFEFIYANILLYYYQFWF